MTRFTLATLKTATGPRAAIGVGDKYYELSEIIPNASTTIKELLEDWPKSFPILQSLAEDIAAAKYDRIDGKLASDADLHTPVLYPNKLIAVGANYSSHLKEMGFKNPQKWDIMPFFLSPPTTCLVGPGATVSIPRSTKEFDWELELVIVVGKKLRYASREEAAKGIAGYSIGLDLSCRDLTLVDNELRVDLVRGKAQDTMSPVGPFILPAEFLPDVRNLRLTLDVNGKRMMDASTAEMLFTCDEMLSTISQFVTLEPGDVILTGSPAGSAGVHGNCWLKPGDQIHAEIEGIGAFDVSIRND